MDYSVGPYFNITYILQKTLKSRRFSKLDDNDILIFQEQRKKQYEAGGEETVLNLNSNSVGSNEASQEAEHYEMDFQDGQAKYYVKVRFEFIL